MHLLAKSCPAALATALACTLGTAVLAQTPADPVYAVTYLDVSTNWLVQGIGLLKQYREQSMHHAGNLEYAVWQEAARPNRFVIVEGWKDQAAFAAHEKSADTKLFEFTLEAIRNSPPNQHVLQNFANAPSRATPAAGAVYMVEHIDFQPTANADALPHVRALAEASQKEEGVARYDIYQEPVPHANHYSVVAVWTSRAAYDAHEAAPYTRQYRAATVMPAHANLYDQRLYTPLD
ncbi:MAG TPA: antibiotic biosynthesis monooxygenase [Xanthobacteraceae bacterium]|nr:antibiotic biosynthesis monooxygenase [Xanthobacteraceae bacterium]